MIRRAILNHHRPLLIQRALCSTVAIDVSTAPGRLNKAKVSATESIDYTSGDLQGKLATQVRVRGAMTIKEFMTAALTHPVHGYYMRREEVFGRGGDFVTSPEVSQVFGELVGVWCVACWERLGQPSKLRIIEAGPGRGTLIADILRSTAVFPAFHKALAVDLVEVSEHLKESGGTVRVLGSAEVCPGAISFVQQLCKRMAVTRGAALLIDYGADETPADSLRGILRHAAVHPLHRPGFVDLSVDVDFGTLRQVARQTDAAASDAAGVLRCPPLTTQRDFLAAMGLEMRINALLQKTDDVEARRDLVRSASRLIASPGMGTAYKVFSIAHEDVGADGVAGFAEAPRLTEQGSTDGV